MHSQPPFVACVNAAQPEFVDGFRIHVHPFSSQAKLRPFFEAPKTTRETAREPCQAKATARILQRFCFNLGHQAHQGLNSNFQILLLY
eukprot:s2968_g4.t1